MSVIIAPIWKDTQYSAVNTDVLGYYIEIQDYQPIFKGKAYRFPGTNRLNVNVNKICQNYLDNNLPESWVDDMQTADVMDYEAENAMRLFDFCNSDYGDVLNTYQFIYDWSYDDTIDYSTDLEDGYIFSHPINGHYVPGMYLMQTYYNVSATGNTINNVISLNDDDLRRDGTYKQKGCGDYALYYLNAQGGWDSFLIEGNVSLSNNYEKHNINRAFSNQTIAFEENTYISQIADHYEAYTGWLSDEQSERLATHLMSSNRIYMHNLKTGKVFPVLIDNTGIEHKLFKNGHKMVNYQLQITASQKRIRK